MIILRRMVLNLNGCRVYFPQNSIIYQLMRQPGGFEPEVQSTISGWAKDGTYIIDVGANIGLMSMAVLKAYPSAK